MHSEQEELIQQLWAVYYDNPLYDEKGNQIEGGHQQVLARALIARIVAQLDDKAELQQQLDKTRGEVAVLRDNGDALRRTNLALHQELEKAKQTEAELRAVVAGQSVMLNDMQASRQRQTGALTMLQQSHDGLTAASGGGPAAGHTSTTATPALHTVAQEAMRQALNNGSWITSPVLCEYVLSTLTMKQG